MKKLVGVEARRLPKASFAKYMLIEARGLAHLHIADELSKGETDISTESNNTLHSDGTAKKGKTYLTYDVNVNGKNLVLGLRESSSGDAQTQLDVFLEVLNEIGQMNKN